jgi:hypothetical protein
MGTCQNDPLRGALFALGHFRALHFIASCFPYCLFPSIINETHIIGPPLIISSAYEHFKIKFRVIGLFIKLLKCVTWSPFYLLFDFNTPSRFTTHQRELEIWGFHWAPQLHIILHQICLVREYLTCGAFSQKWVMLKYPLEC